MLVLPSRIIVGLFLIVILGLPLVTQDPYVVRIVILTSHLCHPGRQLGPPVRDSPARLNFGHALFFGVGAYGSAILNTHLHIPPWGSVPLGAVVAVLAGLIIGIPCLRLKHTYLALTTFAFPIILMGIIIALPDLTGR